MCLATLILSINPCLSAFDQAYEKIETNGFPMYSLVKKPFLRWFTKSEFRTDEGPYAKGKVSKFEDGKNRFIVRDNASNVIVTASRYKLLPEKTQFYVFRDSQEAVVGYLEIRDTELWKLFTRTSTRLLDIDGIPLLKSIYFPSGSSFSSYDLQTGSNQPVIEVYKEWSGDYEISLQKPSNIYVKVLLAFFQVQVSRTELESPEGLYCYGSVHIDDLASFSRGISPKVFSVEEELLTDDNDLWMQLKDVLVESAADVELSDDQFDDIFIDLAHRFEDEHKNVDPCQLLEAVDQLHVQEKAVLLKLIEEKMLRQ